MSEITKEFVEELEAKQRDLIQRRVNVLANIQILERQREALSLDISKVEGALEIAQMVLNGNGSSNREN